MSAPRLGIEKQAGERPGALNKVGTGKGKIDVLLLNLRLPNLTKALYAVCSHMKDDFVFALGIWIKYPLG